MDAYLIKNTTREQRAQIIRKSLDCGGGGCENCSSCGAFGAIDPYEMYKPYIDGEKELAEIHAEFRSPYLVK